MQSSGIQLRIGDFLFSIQKRWKLIVALTFVGLLFGLLLSGVTYVQSGLQSFEISGSFAINTLTNERHLDGNPNPAYNDFMLPPEMVDAINYVVQSDHVLNEVINRQNLLGMSATLLRKNLTLTQYNATQIVEMQVNWYNAEEGVGIWNALIDVTNETVPKVLQLGSVAVINEPEAVMVGAGGSSGKLWVALTLLGFLAGLGFAVMELLMHPTLTNIKDVETVFGMETFGVIPRDNAYFRRKRSFLVQDDIDSSEVVQNFSAAAYILRNRLGMKEKHHCFYVTSATAQEGKSTVAANLAIQLSDMEHRTLLVDFDMRNARLGSMFLENVDYGHSFNALYSGEANIQDAVTTLTGYLDILPAIISNSIVTMDSTIVELFDQLKEQYEYIVIDAPPVGEVSGTLSLNQVSNTALFVIGYDMASIPEIQNSLEKLDKTGVRILGCVVNAAQTGISKGVGKDEAKEFRKNKKKKKAREPESFVPNENEGKTGAEELVTESPDKKKKEKKKWKFFKSKAPAPAPVTEKAEGPIPVRNAFEDILEKPAPAVETASNEQIMTELIKLGITGDFGAETSKEPDGDEHPAEASADSAESPVGEDTTAPTEAGETPEPVSSQEASPAPEKAEIAAAEPVVAPEAKPALTLNKEPDFHTQSQSAPAPQVILAQEPAAETPIEAPVSKAPVALPVDLSPAAETQTPTEGVKAESGRKKARLPLALYVLLAIPCAVLGVAALAVTAAAFLCASTVSFVLCAKGIVAVFQTYTALAERLAAASWSVIFLALAAGLLWLFLLTLLKAIPGFVRRVIKLGRKLCLGEVDV